MQRFFEISSLRDAMRVCVLLTLLAVVASFGVAEGIAHLIGQPTDWKHYVFSFGMPMILTPLVAVPLVGMNLRLNKLRTEMQELARTDSLTGLLNRRAFFENVTRAIAAGTGGAAMMMIDVDNFKTFNDTHGHDAGDAVLRLMAKTILSVAHAVGAPDAVHLARMGGEEFALLVTGMTRARAEKLAAAICAQVRASQCDHRGHHLQATVSIGVAVGTGSETAERLLKCADTAVYEAKRTGRDRWCMATRATIASGNGVSLALRAQCRAA